MTKSLSVTRIATQARGAVRASLFAAAVALLAGSAVGAEPGAPAAPAAAGAAAMPHRVALIDMAYVFKKYSKFEVLRNDLKTEIEQSEVKAREMANELQTLQKEMKSFSEGSPEFADREQQLASKSAEFETFRRSQQREFLKRESQMYHSVYMEVGDAVRKYAEYYKYSLVLRFNREELDSENPAQILQGMNRQVVFYHNEDDITDPVLTYLNGRYEKSSGGARPAAPAAAAPAAAGQATRPAATQRN